MNWLQSCHALWDPLASLRLPCADPTEDALDDPKALLKKLRQTLVRHHGTSESGLIRSLFLGQGLDFEHLREYQAGDELRKMDWNVFARTGVPHVKEHREERHVPVWFFVDATAPMYFGQTQSKLQWTRQLISWMGVLALQGGHRIGLILWQGDAKPLIITPRQQSSHLQWILKTLSTVEAKETKLTPPVGFPELHGLLQTKSVIMVLSDFLFLDCLPEASRLLARLAKKHAITHLVIVDPVEKLLIPGLKGLRLVMPPESPVWLKTDSPSFLSRYQTAFEETLSGREKQLTTWGRTLRFSTANTPLEALLTLVQAP